MKPNIAEGIVQIAIEEDSIDCGDCGRTVDVSDCDDELQVVVRFKQHTDTHH